MPRFRKKPVVIEAFQWTCGPDQIVDPIWIKNAIQNRAVRFVGNVDMSECVMEIDTLEGKMAAQPGDYIIRGVKGEIYPCKPDIFEATYEQEE